MLIELHEDIINIIFQHLDWRGSFSLKSCCKHMNNLKIKLNIVSKRLIEGVGEELENIFGDNTDKFKALLEECNGVISGSLLVQKLLGTKWDNSDVDIYIPSNITTAYNYTLLENFLYNYPECKFKTSFDCSAYGSDIGNNELKIGWTRTYKIKDKSIQIIHLCVNSMIDNAINFINTTFDFDFCKNVYYIQNGHAKAIINNIDELKNKNFTFKYAYRLGSSIDRAFKYIDRGFTMTNNVKYREALINPGKFNIYNATLESISELGEYIYSYIGYIPEHYEHKNGKVQITKDKHNDCEKRCPLAFFGEKINHVHVNAWGRRTEYIFILTH